MTAKNDDKIKTDESQGHKEMGGWENEEIYSSYHTSSAVK